MTLKGSIPCALAIAAGVLQASISAALDGTGAPADTATQHATEVPAAVVPGAIEHLKARVGDRFYSECLTIRKEPPNWLVNPIPEDYSSREARMVGAWYVLFDLAVPSKPFVKGLVTVIVDSTGAPVESFEITGIGRCVEHPEECRFPIDEAGAREIARREGLQEGIKPWEAHIVWNRHGFHLWVVKNTLRDNGCMGEGRSLSINAATGAVYQRSIWDSICD